MDGEEHDRRSRRTDRDAAADERDRRAAERDRRSAERDRRATGLDTPMADALDDLRQAAQADRLAAAADRREAATDRRNAAADRRQAASDALTGAMLRGPGLDALLRAVERAHRSGDQLVVAFIDVDGLKAVNDARGHAAGDDVLRAVAAAMRDALRPYDLIIRYGGDEFVCGLDGMTLEQAQRRMHAVELALRNGRGHVSITAGLAQLRGGEAVVDVLRRADEALYVHRRGRRSNPRAG